MTYQENHNNLVGNKLLMILLDGVKQKFDGVLDSVPPDKCCKVLDGELNSENFADSDGHILLKKWGGVIIKCDDG